MQKLYDRIYWENDQAPALNDTNLNAMSKAIDDIDNRVISIAPETLMQDITQLREDIVEVEADIEEVEEQVALAQGYAVNASESAQAAEISAQEAARIVEETAQEAAEEAARQATETAVEAAETATSEADESRHFAQFASNASRLAGESADAAAASAQEAAEIVDLNWNRVTGKPFTTIGTNLSVDSQGALNAKGGGHTIKNTQGTTLPQRSGLKIVSDVATVTDNAGADTTEINIPDMRGKSTIIVGITELMQAGNTITVQNSTAGETYSKLLTTEDITAGKIDFEVKNIGTWKAYLTQSDLPVLVGNVIVTFHGTYTINGSRANDSDRNLMANNLPFRFGYDSETQQYGYILPDGEGGADTVHPFSSSASGTIVGTGGNVDIILPFKPKYVAIIVGTNSTPTLCTYNEDNNNAKYNYASSTSSSVMRSLPDNASNLLRSINNDGFSITKLNSRCRYFATR